MGISIKQIAELAGVSRGTVDRALNDRPGIRPEIKQHVLTIAESLGYRSNRAGKLLGLHKTPICMGIQMPSEGNDFFNDIQAGLKLAEKELEDFGVSLQIRTMKGFSARKQAEQIRELTDNGAQAIAFVPIDHPLIRQLLEELAAKGIPVMTFNTDIEHSVRLGYVGNDYVRSGETAAGLIGCIADFRDFNVLVLTGSVQMLGHNQRIAGFNKVIRAHYPNLHILDIHETEDDDQISFDLTTQALHDYPQLHAIYLTAGGVAGCCRAISQAGLAGKIKVVGFDRTPSTEDYLQKGVMTATIEQEPFQQGYLAVKSLFDFLLDGTRPPERHLTRNEIVIRENAAIPPYSDGQGHEPLNIERTIALEEMKVRS